MSFEQWMKAVDRIISDKTGMSLEDLPDICYRDMYDSGKTTLAAARKAIKNAKD